MQPDFVDVFDLDMFVRGDHHEMFRRLRAEAPVSWHADPHGKGEGFWNIVSHADLQMVNRDTATFSSQMEGALMHDQPAPSGFDSRGKLLIDTDAPVHTRYRRLINKGFTPRMVGLLEQYLQHRAELIVDNVIERGECDFVGDLAMELPLQAIAEIMGVPQEDRRLIFDWSNKMVGAQDPEYTTTGELADMDEATVAAGELYVYVNQLREERASDPRDDIVTKLINAEIEGDRLSDEEFEMFMLLLSVAGNETTRNATSHGMWGLMSNPDQFELLKSDLDAHVGNMIEETVRWGSPVMHFRRQTTGPCEVGGVPIDENEKVVMWHVSANRDESLFDDPNAFDIERPNAIDHVGFGGGGAHYCLGANLAKAELRIIFTEIATRMPDITFTSPPERLRSNFIQGIKHIPVTFTPGVRKHAVEKNLEAASA